MKTWENYPYPTVTEEDGRSILRHILDQLLADPDCRYTFRQPATKDEEANQNARFHIDALIRGEIPVFTYDEVKSEICVDIETPSFDIDKAFAEVG